MGGAGDGVWSMGAVAVWQLVVLGVVGRWRASASSLGVSDGGVGC